MEVTKQGKGYWVTNEDKTVYVQRLYVTPTQREWRVMRAVPMSMSRVDFNAVLDAALPTLNALEGE